MEKKKLVIGIISLIVAIALAFTICIGSLGFTNWNVKTWFNAWGKGFGGEVKVDGVQSSMLITEGKSNGVAMSCRALSVAEFEEYGIDTQAESAYTLTATIIPVGADDKRVEWTVDPVTGDTDASEYIDLNADGLSATVACKKDFDVQFIVTVKSLENPLVKATCTLDYVERVTGVEINMPEFSSPNGEITYTLKTSKYTIKATDAENLNVTINGFQFNEGFADEFKNILPLAEFTFLHPLHTNELVKYTSTGVEFLHGNRYCDEQAGDVCYDGLMGCLFTMSEQSISGIYDEGDIRAAFISTSAKQKLGTVEVAISSTYGGTTYSTVNETVDIWVDGEAFHVPVAGISMSDTSLLY